METRRTAVEKNEQDALQQETQELQNHEDSSRRKLVGMLAVVLVLLLAAGAFGWLQRPESTADNGSPDTDSDDVAQLVLPVTLTPGGQEAADAVPGSETESSIPTPTLEEVMLFFAEGAPYRGAEEAPVIIIEFSDYMCPYCGYFNLETLPKILEAYPDEVRFAHRDFLNFGEASYHVAHSVACAGEQDRYWEMRDAYFSEFEGMGLEDLKAMHSDEEAFQDFVAGYNQERILEFADEAGLDLGMFSQCMAEQRFQEQIAFDYELGAQLEVPGIPFFIVNGTLVNGAVPYEEFVDIIENALAGQDAGD